MPIRTRCSPTSTSRGRSERGGESVDQVDHDRVRGLTVIGVRGRTRRARAAGGYLARLAGVVGVLAGVVLGNGVHCAGGMTAMAIEHAASSRMPAGIAQSLATAGPSILSRVSPPPTRSLRCSWGAVALCEAGPGEIVDSGWSDRQGQLVEGSWDPQVHRFLGPEFVVAAAEVLHKGTGVPRS
jgi:hypothetical protein